MTSPPDPAVEDGLIPLSALQHHLFCPRQCALIHVEALWAEDGATVAGRILHEKVDAGGADQRPGLRTTRGMALRSLALGVVGRADVVEWQGSPARPIPVEYKRGKPKAHRADEVQLCAQAICLEEMLGVAVPEGALFYGQTRRRLGVRFDEGLRTLTAATAHAARANIATGRTPLPVHSAACGKCSLQDLCSPAAMQAPPGIEDWLIRQIED